MKRKIVALLLVALICASLFTLAACNNEKGQGGGGTTPTNEFNVVFTVGANVYSCTVKSGEAIPYDKVTLPQGATLTGLYSDADMTVPVDKTSKVTADMRIWVDWEYIPYTLTFDAAGGEGTYEPATVYAGDIVDVPAMPTRDGYVFAYWYDAEEGEDSAFDFANDRVPERNLTLVAKWNIVSNAGFYGGTADGNPHDAVTLNVYDDAAFVKQYSLDGGEWTEQVPQITEVGAYKVAYRVLDGETVVEEGEGYAVIGSAEQGTTNLKITAKPQSVVYNSMTQYPSADEEFYTVEGLKDGHSVICVFGTDNAAVNAGEYSYGCVAFAVKDADGNDVTSQYRLVAEKSVFAIEKATPVVYAVTQYVDGDRSEHSYSADGVTVAQSYNNQTVNVSAQGFVQGRNEVAVTLAGNENWNECSMTAVLEIRSARIGDKTYAFEDALKIGGDIEIFSHTLISEDVILRRGTKVAVLSSSDGSLETARPSYGDGVKAHVDANAEYVENIVTVAEDATFEIDGDFILCALLGQNGQGISGHTSGKYAQLNNSGKVVVADGGNLDVRGYIKGNGTVEAKNGAAIYAPFVVYDFRGGSNTAIAYLKGKIAPFNTYDLFYNIQCNLNIEYGADYVSYLDLYANYDHNFAQAKLISTEEAFIKMYEGSEIKVSFVEDDYDWSATSGTNEITLVGKQDLSDLTLSVAGISVSMSSVDLGFSHRFRLHIGDGTTPTEVMFPYNYKMLTGSQITVEKNAVMNVQGRFMVYTEFTDGVLAGISYAQMPAAKFVVNGTLNVESGATFGGRITGEENGGKVVFGADTTLTMTTVEGNSGGSKSIFGYGGTFYMTNTLTEEARFDEGVLAVSTDTPKTNEKGYSYVERIRSYEAQQKLSSGTTYVFDGSNWTAQ